MPFLLFRFGPKEPFHHERIKSAGRKIKRATISFYVVFVAADKPLYLLPLPVSRQKQPRRQAIAKPAE